MCQISKNRLMPVSMKDVPVHGNNGLRICSRHYD